MLLASNKVILRKHSRFWKRAQTVGPRDLIRQALRGPWQAIPAFIWIGKWRNLHLMISDQYLYPINISVQQSASVPTGVSFSHEIYQMFLPTEIYQMRGNPRRFLFVDTSVVLIVTLSLLWRSKPLMMCVPTGQWNLLIGYKPMVSTTPPSRCFALAFVF